ncbi:MAG TPA: hypothetical protein VM308_06395 [Sphingomicrobium sp.]|nr:hypothetical protein [Sphingomicrobium sp.]
MSTKLASRDWTRGAARAASILLALVGACSLYLAALTHALAPYDFASIGAFAAIGIGSLIAAVAAWRSRAGAQAALLWLAMLLAIWLCRSVWIPLVRG